MAQSFSAGLSLSKAGPRSRPFLRRAGFDKLSPAVLVAALLAATTPAHAQQAGPPPGVVQQPFGQPPPPPPPPPPPQNQQGQGQGRQGEQRLPRGWLFRGMVAAAPALDVPIVIDEPVTGYGNEALWDVPKITANPAKVAAAPPQR